MDEEFPENFCEIVRGNEKTRRKKSLMKKHTSDLKKELEFTMATIFEEEEQEVQYDDLQCVRLMSNRVPEVMHMVLKTDTDMEMSQHHCVK